MPHEQLIPRIVSKELSGLSLNKQQVGSVVAYVQEHWDSANATEAKLLVTLMAEVPSFAWWVFLTRRYQVMHKGTPSSRAERKRLAILGSRDDDVHASIAYAIAEEDGMTASLEEYEAKHGDKKSPPDNQHQKGSQAS